MMRRVRGAATPTPVGPRGTMSAMDAGMLEGLGPALEGHLMRAVLISGVMALVLTAGVALVWWRGRRWAKSRNSSAWAPRRHVAAFSRTSGTSGHSAEGDPQPGHERRTGNEELAPRLIREAATRAAALREAWDRSYREARSPGAEATAVPSDQAALLEEVLREQRETNALLRELVAGLRQTRD